MKFSVIIPTYNRADLLDACLRSLSDQTFADFEVLVCDDGSTDNSAQVARSYSDRLNIQYLWAENSGGPATPRNRGIQAAKGEWICFLDSDDRWTPDKLEACLAHLDSSDFIYHKMQIYSQTTGLQNAYTEAYLPANPKYENMLRLGNCCTNSSVVIRREIVEKVGPLNEEKELVAVEDFDYWLRVAQITDKFACLDKSLGYYWIGESSISFTDKWFDRQNAIYNRHLVNITNPKIKDEIIARQEYRIARYYHCYYHNYAKAAEHYKNAAKSNNYPTKVKALAFTIVTAAKKLFQSAK